MYVCFLYVTAFTIILTLPVSVASNERSFSKLIAAENIFESSYVSRYRLSDLGSLSIERNRFPEIDKRKLVLENVCAEKGTRSKKILYGGL